MVAVWVDSARCTGCGACLEVCPEAAIRLLAGKAQVDAQRCRGCEDCVKVCPTYAIQPVIELSDALVTTSAQPLAQSHAAPLAQSRARRQTAIAFAVIAGTGLAIRAGRAVARAIGMWVLPSQSHPSRTGRIRRPAASLMPRNGQRFRRRQRGR